MASTPASHLNPAAPEIHSNGLVSKISSQGNDRISDVPQGMNAPSNVSYQLEPHKKSFKEVMVMQRQQNEQVIATHQQLAAAMTLPQPEVHKFKGDPIKYKYGTFIMAFNVPIESGTSNAADRLYYLEQHLEGEPRELIGGCLHMDPSVGYKEARKLLEKEYGDPFKVLMAYVTKVLKWSPIEDAPALKRFSLFLVKCKNVMMSVSHMIELNHPTNMQTIAKKLSSICRQDGVIVL